MFFPFRGLSLQLNVSHCGLLYCIINFDAQILTNDQKEEWGKMIEESLNKFWVKLAFLKQIWLLILVLSWFPVY